MPYTPIKRIDLVKLEVNKYASAKPGLNPVLLIWISAVTPGSIMNTRIRCGKKGVFHDCCILQMKLLSTDIIKGLVS